jgi:hypothetical protein
MELKAESRAESGFPQGTLLPNIRSPGPTRLTVQHIDMSDLYIYFAILIYMALHIENDTEDYWSQARNDSPTHLPVIQYMGQNRWHNIHRAFHISDLTIPGKTTVFQKVEPLNSYIVVG